MPSVNCFRRVLLDVGGKKTIISVPHGMTETEVNKVLVVTRAYLLSNMSMLKWYWQSVSFRKSKRVF